MMARDKSIPRPPVGASRHRRWRVWFDFGEIEAGATIRETKWRAIAPGSREQIEAGDWNDILAGIDEIQDAQGSEGGDRLHPIDYNPPRTLGPWKFWSPEDPNRPKPTGEKQ